MLEHFTKKAIKTLDLARCEAVRLGQDSIREEHVLTAIQYEGTNVPAKTLRAFGVQLKDLREVCEKTSGRGNGAHGFEIPFSPEVQKIFSRALQHATECGRKVAGTGELMLALIVEDQAPAVSILRTLGIEPDEVRDELSYLLSSMDEA